MHKTEGSFLKTNYVVLFVESAVWTKVTDLPHWPSRVIMQAINKHRGTKPLFGRRKISEKHNRKFQMKPGHDCKMFAVQECDFITFNMHQFAQSTNRQIIKRTYERINVLRKMHVHWHRHRVIVWMDAIAWNNRRSRWLDPKTTRLLLLLSRNGNPASCCCCCCCTTNKGDDNSRVLFAPWLEPYKVDVYNCRAIYNY